MRFVALKHPRSASAVEAKVLAAAGSTLVLHDTASGAAIVLSETARRALRLVVAALVER